MANERVALLWTIVIVFISQLFHSAYTTTTTSTTTTIQQQYQQQASKHTNFPFGLGTGTGQQYHHFGSVQPAGQQMAIFSRPEPQMERETYEELLSASSSGQTGNDPTDQMESFRPQTARERCRELISLTLLSFRDLSPDERATEEIDCANLREQIAAASKHSSAASATPNKPLRTTRPPVMHSFPEEEFRSDSADTSASLPSDDFPLAPVYHNNKNLNRELPLDSFAGVQAQATRKQTSSSRQALNTLPPMNFNSSLSSSSSSSSSSNANNLQNWQPKSNYMNQMQQLLILQQHQQRQRLQQQENLQPLLQFLQHHQQSEFTTTTVAPTTQATTFESLFETTLQPTTTTSTTTTTTTSTTTTTTTTTTTPPPRQPKLRVTPRARKPKLIKSTTTTTTTTTAKPQDDYLDDTESPPEEEEDYDQATTTTTTTRAPRRSSKKARKRTTTTQKPSTTTLSPGYQPRPDGRIIDYMADPNFPRELKGADLTNYPFYISVPEKIDFECKGRHDGYYSNIDLHCQIYHHCAIGNRYDFLCPNYTLFDQTTFTCRFINTVDCVGSEKHYDKNNALYIEKDDKDSSKEQVQQSTSSSTTTTSTVQTPAQPIPKLNIQLRPTKGTPAPVSALSLIQQTGSKPANGATRKKRTITQNG